MTTKDLNPGAVIQMRGERIYIDAQQTTTIGTRQIAEFRVRRGQQVTSIWTCAQQVQKWLDGAEWIDNPA